MTATITHQTIMMLARDRLDQIDQILGAKERSGLAVEPIDKQIRYLARRAAQFMGVAPQPQVHFPERPLTTAFGTGVSKFAVFGSLGPDIAEFAALMAEGQLWARDILHKGNADPNREAVRARSIDFVLTFWKRAEAVILQLPTGRQNTTRDQLRAYVLGHMCRIAGDIVLSPYLDDIEWQFGSVLHASRLRRATIEATLDSAVADRVLRSPGSRRGAVWTAWWPSVDDVPPEFYDVFAGAFQDIYLQPSRPLGFAEFEQKFTSNPPPAMSPLLVKDGYRAYLANLQRGYDWTYGDWLVALLPLFAPAIIAMPVIVALPNAKDLTSSQPHDETKAWAEALGLPLAATSLVPLIYSIYLTANSSLGAGTPSVLAIVLGILCVIAAVFFFATLVSGIDPWVQIVLLFLVPVVLELAYFIWLKVRGGSEQHQRILGWAFMAQVSMAVLTTLAYLVFHGWLSKGPKDVLFWVSILIWGGNVAGLWLLLALALRDSASPEIAADSFALDRRHYVRLFDDSSLFSDAVADASRLEKSFFPSGSRKLLKIWWSGDKEMHIRSRRHSIQFSHDATDANAQIVLAPIGPMTAREFASVLMRTVKDHAGVVGGLHAEIVHVPEADLELPPGETFADHGDLDDTLTTRAARDAAAAEWRHLGKSASEREYFIQHAPKLRQSIQFGPDGPVVQPLVPADATGGALTVALAVGGGAGPNDLDGAAGTRFATFFRVGDVIESPVPGTRRTVVNIVSDTRLTTVLPVGAGGVFQRIAQDRTVDVAGVGNATIAAATPRTVTGAGTQFASLFMHGDTIRVGTQQRVVDTVVSDASLTVDADFPPIAASPFFRIASEAAGGYELIANTAGSFSNGDTIMDYAADLAVMLCLGGTTYLLSDEERRAGGANGAPAQVHKVVQVFRNWDLDRRRLNEWRMLIAGEATSEKHGNPEAPDEMIPALPENWSLRSPAGEATATALGWIPLARKWLDVARRPGVSSKGRTSLHPGDPSNLELSRGMAYLFDMPDPDPDPPGP